MLETILWILFWTLIWPLGAWAIDRLVNPRTPERRVARLLAWYPAAWREQHGGELAALLHDTMAAGRDDVRMSLDIAREGIAERLRATRRDRIAAGAMIGVGWTMFFPQGIVAAVLSLTAAPPSWFLALHVGGDERWLVVGFMVGVGLLLIERGMRLVDAAGRPGLGQRAG